MITEGRPWLRWVLFGVGTAVLLAGAGLAAVLLDGGGDDGPSYPKAWDAEVLPFVEIVEGERDLEFKHPIRVEFLTDKEFRKQVTSDEDDLTKEDKKDLENWTGLLRAVGLLEGDVDLFESMNDLSGGGVIGLYDYEDERIRIRGKELTAASKATLVHELTHVLQDQHFDLEKQQEKYDDEHDTARSEAFTAIVEGDASRIETAYAESLSEAEAAELEKEQEAEIAGAEEDTADVPEVLDTFMGAPYALGEALLDLAVELDGNDVVDRLLEDPPSSDEHLVNPWTLLSDKDDPAKVDKPKLAKGEKKFDSGVWGMLSWYFLLAERLPLLDALDAADGWGGDAYVGFESDDVSCVKINYEGDTDDDTDRMHQALQTWVQALPDSPASVERTDDGLRFESCDPGTDADVGQDASDTALQLAVTRTYMSIQFTDEGADEDVARCFSDALVHKYTLDQLTDPEFGADDPKFEAQIEKLIATCS